MAGHVPRQMVPLPEGFVADVALQLVLTLLLHGVKLSLVVGPVGGEVQRCHGDGRRSDILFVTYICVPSRVN